MFFDAVMMLLMLMLMTMLISVFIFCVGVGFGAATDADAKDAVNANVDADADAGGAGGEVGLPQGAGERAKGQELPHQAARPSQLPLRTVCIHSLKVSRHSHKS
jgi:hypothetical protein